MNQTSTGSTLLRAFKKEDAMQLAVMANNLNIARNLRDGFPHPYALDDAIAFIDKCLTQYPLTTFAIEYNGIYVGNIGLMIGEDVYRKSAEIGYFVDEQYWGKGIATESVNLISNYGFGELNLSRIHTGIFEYNTASMRVLEKCGYTKDCIFRKAIYKNNQIWDEHRYSRINPVIYDL